MRRHPRIRRWFKWGGLALSGLVGAVWIYSYLFPIPTTGPGYGKVPLNRRLAVNRGDLFYVTDDCINDGFGTYESDSWRGFSIETCNHYMAEPTRAYRVSLAIPFLACLAYPATRLALWLAGRSDRRYMSRYASGLCVNCGYNLTGNTSGVCPECGTPVPGHKP